MPLKLNTVQQNISESEEMPIGTSKMEIQTKKKKDLKL